MGECITFMTKVLETTQEKTASQARKPELSSSLTSPIDHNILSLQRTFGNQAVQRMMQSEPVQAKLRVGKFDKKYEREADRVADQVMRMPEPRLQRQSDEGHLQTKPLTDQITPLVQRQVKPGHEEEEEELLQAKAMSSHSSAERFALESQINTLRGGGQPLPRTVRNFFEPRFGYNFSQVRIHTDAQAAESARVVNAHAYTIGRDMVFGAGQYTSGTNEGRRLLAHELTHTIQQSKVGCHQAKPQIDQIDVSYEQEADCLADQGTRGGTTAESPTTSVVKLQRKPDVGFVTHALGRNRGRLDDPIEDGAGNVSWPLSFAVTSPLEANADVEVTGSAGDPCPSYQVGFLQTVHSNWLHVYYWGQSAGGGSTIIRYSAPTPIRDGEPGTMWYASSRIETPTACNTHVYPGMDDYPTIFSMPKVRTNSLTGQPNYLTGVGRGISFVTTLAASGPGGVKPLRFFYWNYQMEIDFRPNYAAPNAAWPFVWKKNMANLGAVHTGKDSSVPLFTSASIPYNNSITMVVNERQ